MSNPFDKPTSTPTLSFSTKDEYGRTIPKPIGTRLGGVVQKSPEVVQSRVYEGADKGKPEYWCSDSKGKKVTNATTADGRANNPVVQIVIPVMCDDGEVRSFWISYYPKNAYESIQQAITTPDGTIRAIEPGDKLYGTLSGLTPVPGKNPSYNYMFEFTKGAGVFSPAATVAASPPPPPAAGTTAASAPPVPPAPAAEPVLSNGYTATQLRAAQWTEDQIAALSAPVAAPAPPAAPAPSAAPTAPAEASVDPETAVATAAAAKQAKIDAMPEADRKLLGL